MTILEDEEERKKEIQVVKQIARANGYQPEEVDRVIGKMSARKGMQTTTVLKLGNTDFMALFCNQNSQTQLKNAVGTGFFISLNNYRRRDFISFRKTVIAGSILID